MATERADDCVSRMIAGAASGFAAGAIGGAITANWSEVPLVLRNKAWPALQRTGDRALQDARGRKTGLDFMVLGKVIHHQQGHLCRNQCWADGFQCWCKSGCLIQSRTCLMEARQTAQDSRYAPSQAGHQYVSYPTCQFIRSPSSGYRPI